MEPLVLQGHCSNDHLRVSLYSVYGMSEHPQSINLSPWIELRNSMKKTITSRTTLSPCISLDHLMQLKRQLFAASLNNIFPLCFQWMVALNLFTILKWNHKNFIGSLFFPTCWHFGWDSPGLRHLTAIGAPFDESQHPLYLHAGCVDVVRVHINAQLGAQRSNLCLEWVQMR